jgi:hypothetical protein
VSFRDVALRFFGLFLLIGPLGRLEHLICKTLEFVVVSGLVLSLGVENAGAIQEAFKFIMSRPVLLVASQPFHHVDGTIHFPLLIIALGRARLIHVARVHLLLLYSGFKGHLLCQGVLVGDSQHLF